VWAIAYMLAKVLADPHEGIVVMCPLLIKKRGITYNWAQTYEVGDISHVCPKRLGVQNCIEKRDESLGHPERAMASLTQGNALGINGITYLRPVRAKVLKCPFLYRYSRI